MASPAIALGVLTVDARLPRRFVPAERLSRRVLLAEDALDGPVAIKLAEGPEAARSRALARELERLGGLSHPAFPRAGSFGFLDDGRAWLSMERCTGELPVGPMAWGELARLADGLCEALSYLHARRLLHRDLKPDHVRFDAATGRVMLLDLGSAAPPGVAGRVGTPGYMAPEIVAGKRADERSDVFGLGAVLYELATGRSAHAGDSATVLRAQREGRFEPLRSFRPDAPERFADLVESMLAPEPKSRPRSMQSVREQVADALGAVPGMPCGDAPLTGRDRELDSLVEMAERARQAPVAVTVAGPEGSGRTSLLESLRCRLLLGGMPVLRRSGRGLSMRALSRDLALIVDAPVGATPGEALEEIESALAGAVSAVSANASLRGPLAILIDDAPAAGGEARADLAALATSLPPGVLLVVVDGPRGEALGRTLPARIDLGPLPEAAVRDLLEALLRRPPDEEIVARALASPRQPADVVAAPSAGRGSERASSDTCHDDDDPAALLRRGRIAAAVAAWQARHLALPDGFEGERARCLARLGHALWAMAEPADALARAEAALALAASCGDAPAEAEAARVLGRIYGSFGSTRDAVGWQRRALEIAAQDDGVPRAAALSELGMLMLREGHVEPALRALTESVREAETCKDAAGAALSRARLGQARLMSGDLGGADRLLRRALAEARAADDCLTVIEAQRLLGAATSACGDDAGLALLHSALARAGECGVLQELPALHEALAQAYLRQAVRLRTPTGAIVDRRKLEVARAHVEKGLDLALATGRMADRAALAVLSARCALLLSDSRAALVAADEAHVLALEAGDLLVASKARLVKSEALLDLREFGVALAEARIAAEALQRSGDLEEAWRGHALLARIHGAWGMGARQVEETLKATRLLHQLESSIRDPRSRRAYMADVERAAAVAPPVSADATKARRGLAPELEGSRFAGRADTEDLVEALIAARRRTAELERRTRTARLVARDARGRRDALLRATSLAGAAAGAPSSKELSRVLDLLSRACGGARIVLATSEGGRLRVRGAAGARGACDPSAHEAALVVARHVVETGKGSLALGAMGHRKTDPPSGEVHVALPLEAEGSTHGALVVRPCEGRTLRRADVRLLRAVASLLSRAVSPALEAEEATPGK